MKQSNLASLFETFGGTALGFVVSLAIQYGICRYYGLPLSTSDNLGIIGIFTAASLLRGFAWRRVCEALHVRRSLSPFMQAAIAERFRQIEQEGWSLEHDDMYPRGDLALAGACYAEAAGLPREHVPVDWPWVDEWWKPAGFRRDLVKAAALIIAEGDKFDRSRSKREARR